MSKPLHIFTVVGARPQFIKAAVVSRAIAEHNRSNAGRLIQEEIVHTGQHYDTNMSQVFFNEMEIPPPAVNLGVGSGSHAEITGRMLMGLEREMIARRPDLVLIYGDTNSTLAAALAAVKLHIPVAHVEAGLRSFNLRMAEEVNRVIADRCSAILFCPSAHAAAQLAKEGITAGVYVVGDVMYDAVLYYRRRAIAADEGDFALATIHRAENTDDSGRLRQILEGLGNSPLPVILPLHPRTRKRIEIAGIAVPSRIRIKEPVSYFQMLGLLERCTFVATDSGGLQKEAYFFRKRCLTMRDETEWTELVAAGINRLVGADAVRLANSFAWALEPFSVAAGEIYGSGKAGATIVEILAGYGR